MGFGQEHTVPEGLDPLTTQNTEDLYLLHEKSLTPWSLITIKKLKMKSVKFHFGGLS